MIFEGQTDQLKDILKNITTMKRAKQCLDYWIPLLIKVKSKTNDLAIFFIYICGFEISFENGFFFFFLVFFHFFALCCAEKYQKIYRS